MQRGERKIPQTDQKLMCGLRSEIGRVVSEVGLKWKRFKVQLS